MDRETIGTRTKQLPMKEYGDAPTEEDEVWRGEDGGALFVFSRQELLIKGASHYTLLIYSSDATETIRLANEFIEVFGEPIDVVFKPDTISFSWPSYQVDERLEGNEKNYY